MSYDTSVNVNKSTLRDLIEAAEMWRDHLSAFGDNTVFLDDVIQDAHDALHGR